MRCPKCGYTSFDHLNTCKKCGKDLNEFKHKYGIRSVLVPGQNPTEEGLSEPAYDIETADAAVAAATSGAVTGATGAAEVAVDEPAAAEESAESEVPADDFGFDFMGDSAEDDDLSFDELFEEAPEDEDIEEVIEGPKEPVAADPVPEQAQDFSFDLPEDDDLDDSFGFDPAGDQDEVGEGDEIFSFSDDADLDQDESEDREGPPHPFELPELSRNGGAPVIQQQEITHSPVENTGCCSEPEPLTIVSNSGNLRPELDMKKDLEIEPLSEPVASPLVVSVSSCTGAFVFDLLLLFLIGTIFVVVAEWVIASGHLGGFSFVDALIDLAVPYFLVFFSLAFGYFTLFHALLGQTPGKMLFGLRVATLEGEVPGLTKAFLRSAGGLSQLFPLGLGYLATMLRSDRRGWNDRLAGTQVIAVKTVNNVNQN